VKSSAQLDRKDRLFPADSEVFETNPLGIAHGAIGVLYAISKIDKKVDPALLDWVVAREINPRQHPPGLAAGVAGMAWAMLEIGEAERAEAILSKGVDHPLLATSASLYHGAAGWGMANLKFWLTTGKGAYVDQAMHAGEMILAQALEGSAGLFWPEPDGQIPLGLAHGAAGIGLYFLYLFAATGQARWKELAIKSFDHDIAQAVEQKWGGWSWRKWRESEANIVCPYWEYGSAGMGIACLRFLAVLGDARYQELLEQIYPDCSRKYAVHPGRNMGLAGIGEFLCDAFQFTGQERFRASALRLADGIKLFAIREPEGLAFPCGGARISCDFATGTAGIMLTLDRLVSGRSSDFLPDEILKGVS
jgi:lantibiotic modifying enzyme